MQYRNFRLFSLVFALMLVLQLAACGENSSSTPTSSSVVVFSDVHFNPYYDQSLFHQLVVADTSQWAGIFKSSTLPELSKFGEDTNYPLLVLALSSIKQNLGASPLVIFTGDILGHHFSELFYQNLNGTQNPRDDADVAAMQAFANKTVAFFMDQVRLSAGNLPVMFAVGNDDSYNDSGPDSTFLTSTAELFYSKLLNGTANHQEFSNTFKSGGYYSVELAGTNLVVIGLNTVTFSTYISGNNDSAVNAELAWFDAKLASAKAAGKKVWLLIHVPPGVNTYAAANSIDSNGHLATTNTAMMDKAWKEAYQTSFLQIVAKYPGLIAMTLAGHSHMDEYRILPSSEVVEITSSISPGSGNDPAFKIFTIDLATLKTTGYSSLNYDLVTKTLQFTTFYMFSAAYGLQGFLNDSLTQLFPELYSNNAKQGLYRGYYYSGNTIGNPITTTNWPCYWCSIGRMERLDFINCVNSY